MSTAHIDGIGDVARRPWAALIQFGVQLSAWPFLFIGGIGMAQTLVAYSRADYSPEVARRFFIGIAGAGALLGLGGVLRWLASRAREWLFLPADWYTYMLESDRRDRPDGVLEAARALSALPDDPTTAGQHKMRAKAAVYLALYQGASQGHPTGRSEADLCASALAMLDGVVTAEPDNMQFRVDRAHILQKAGRHQEAVTALDDMVTDNFGVMARMFSLRISSLMALGRYEDALKGCRELEVLAQKAPGGDELRAAAAEHRQEIATARSRESVPAS